MLVGKERFLLSQISDIKHCEMHNRYFYIVLYLLQQILDIACLLR